MFKVVVAQETGIGETTSIEVQLPPKMVLGDALKTLRLPYGIVDARRRDWNERIVSVKKLIYQIPNGQVEGKDMRVLFLNLFDQLFGVNRMGQDSFAERIERNAPEEEKSP